MKSGRRRRASQTLPPRQPPSWQTGRNPSPNTSPNHARSPGKVRPEGDEARPPFANTSPEPVVRESVAAMV